MWSCPWETHSFEVKDERLNVSNERNEPTPKLGQYLEERKWPCEKWRDAVTDGEEEVRMKGETERKKYQVTWGENLTMLILIRTTE